MPKEQGNSSKLLSRCQEKELELFADYQPVMCSAITGEGVMTNIICGNC